MATTVKPDMPAMAGEIARYMEGWTAVPHKYHENDRDYAHLVHTSGARITLQFCAHPQPRINVAAVEWPKDNRGHTHQPYQRTGSINVSPTKAHSVIAKDISQRLLSVYLPEYEARCQEAATWTRMHEQQDSVVRELHTIFNKEVQRANYHDEKSHPSPEMWINERGIYEAKVSHGGEIKLTLEIDLELAKKVIALVHANRPEKS